MKKILIIFICIFIVEKNFAQQNLFTQYMNNFYTVNPAAVGSQNATDFKLAFRRSGMGIEGAPQAVSFNGSTCFLQRYGNQSYFKHGVGLIVNNESAGLLGRTSVQAMYAFHLPINPKKGEYVSLGLTYGFQTYNFDERAKIVRDPSDPVGNTMFNGNTTEGNVSVLWYNPDFFVGMTSNLFTPQKLRWFNDNTLDRVHQFTAGYRFLFAENKFGLIPSCLVRMIGKNINYDATLTLRMQNKFWLGATYRGQQGTAFFVGGGNKIFNLTYSYDYFKAGFNSYHEITLGLKINNKPNRFIKAGSYKPQKGLDVPIWN